jgi:hypothetical protein
MSDALGDAIAMLIGDVATSARAADLVSRWGVAAASRLRPDGIRVECAADAPFAALEIRPWDVDGYGLVDVELRGGTDDGWPEIRDRFGPFDEAAAEAEAGQQLVARQPVSGVASVTLIVELEDDDVTGITIRRDQRRGG